MSVTDSLVIKINSLKSWRVAIIIVIVGFGVFFTGLNNPFIGDDIPQIVNNPVIHSVSNIGTFFRGGTFYTGHGMAPLSGTYYRPLMTTTFSLLYTLFGANPVYFHLLQALLCIGSAILLYLFFKFSFSPSVALFLSLIFLVHPINSQAAFAIPAMQDALFFFFGILALYLLLSFNSIKSLFLVVFCLFLSLIAKETGIVFVAMSLLYLFWWDRKRLFIFMGLVIFPILLWIGLKIQAIGLNPPSHIAPISNLGLSGRLMTIPSILLLFFTSIIFPLKLAQSYYWVYPTFSVQHVLLPLVIDLVVILLFVYGGYLVRKILPRDAYRTYLFFAVWAIIGLLIHLQIIPLDMTACLNWFYFPMVGVLGMVGVILVSIKPKHSPNWVIVTAVLIIGVLGIRTAERGFDYRSQYRLASKDISASKDNYIAYNVISAELSYSGDFKNSKVFAQQSVNIFPTMVNNQNLGNALAQLKDYSGSLVAYNNALKYGNTASICESIANLMLLTGEYNTNKNFILDALDAYPMNSTLWRDLAILEYKNNDRPNSIASITKAITYGQVPERLYDSIVNNMPLTIYIAGESVSIP